MASGDLYELHLIGKLGNQDTLNVFHYLQTAGSNGSLGCITAFSLDVLPYLKEVLTTGTQFLRIFCRDKADATDFSTIVAGTTGDIVDSTLPAHLTWSFTYISNRLDARSGGKRFSGIGESMLSSGVVTGAYIARVAGLAAALEANISSGSDIWRPVIYGHRTGSSSFFTNPLAGVQYLGVTSQNNRKFYTSPGL